MNAVAAAMAAALERAVDPPSWITVPSDPAPVEVIALPDFHPEEWL